MIDTSRWKKFFLKDICSISMGNKMDFSKMSDDNPSIAFIGRSGDNNGFAGMVDAIDGVDPYQAGDVTVALGGSIGTTSIQDKPFYTSQNVAVLHFDDSISIPSKLFIATLIMNECKYKYVAFGRELNTHIRTDFELYLPTTPSGEPDWQYMEDFMGGLHCEPITTSVKSSHLPLETEKWGEFRIGDLFDVRKGKRLTSEDQTEGNTPYVGAIDSNNGIANKIGQLPIHKGGTISLSYNGSVGEAFYQPENYWSTDDVNALYLKPEYGTLSEFIGLFVATLLRQEKYRYSYGRKWVLTEMEDTIIRLPVNGWKII